jgi:hypothetical protein
MLAVFLAVFVTLGIGLSAVQASDMAAKMTMASEMGASVHGGCDGCGGDADKMKSMACASICATPVVAVLPQTPPLMLIETPLSFPRHYPLLDGRASRPDPYPPRPRNFG